MQYNIKNFKLVLLKRLNVISQISDRYIKLVDWALQK
ncbi:hypothetical protein B0I27_103445 [Arcticibacter pallidicorallinus]|uniref:Uncharacterized protein n=1 Tax=Arcticibacter pallidicorallinus TaxID=1259464 RepID=A0A2T0U7W8_9SPHI|nr:hypothetical protein B0I27_103445 [Arcticibacter pallidicorallinus]